MAQFFKQLESKHTHFIQEQKVFFTATAPQDGRINLSPKGMDSFRVLSPTKVAYINVTGSGNETAAHLQQNGRITLMFCSFEKAPLILRIYGKGTNIPKGSKGFQDLAEHFRLLPGTRQIILVEIESVQTSCGFSIPYFAYLGERNALNDWAEKKEKEGEITQYWAKNNVTSIDGLPTGIEANEGFPAQD